MVLAGPGPRVGQDAGQSLGSASNRSRSQRDDDADAYRDDEEDEFDFHDDEVRARSERDAAPARPRHA